jgi:hypothetical protein
LYAVTSNAQSLLADTRRVRPRAFACRKLLHSPRKCLHFGGDKPLAAEGEDLSDIDETEGLLDETNVPDNNHARDDTEAHYNPRHKPLPLRPEYFVGACMLCHHMYENDHGDEEEQDAGMYLCEQRVFAQIKAWYSITI